MKPKNNRALLSVAVAILPFIFAPAYAEMLAKDSEKIAPESDIAKKNTEFTGQQAIRQWAVMFLHPTDYECVKVAAFAKIPSSSPDAYSTALKTYLPQEQDIHAVEDWLRSAGFSFAPSQLSGNAHACTRSLFFTGTEVQAEHAFKLNSVSTLPANAYRTVNGFILPDRFKGIIEDIRQIPRLPIMAKKPVIYLYPPHKMQVSVHLDYDEALTVTYPSYYDGWSVTAYPDGTLTNARDGKEYSYLFWEGSSYKNNLSFKDGFVVRGADSANFLREKLALLGLTPREYNEFIVFWLPELLKNPYNLIHFSGEDYRKKARLTVLPRPDSEIRVFMIFRKISEPLSFPLQALTPAKRKGFAVVEWGGAEVP